MHTIIPYSCLLLYGVTQTIGITFEILFNRRSTRKLETEEVSVELTLRSHIECSLVCSTDPKCDKISWNPHTNTCQLGTEWNDGWKIYRPRLEMSAEWTSYEKIKYPVSPYRGHSGTYTLTFQDAVDLCVTMGTTIASSDTLLQARAEGFESCGCGWLSDGSNGFVMQSHNPKCFHYFTTGILDCYQVASDVYCTVL